MAWFMVHGGPGGSQDGPGGLFTKLAERLDLEDIGSLRFDMLGEGQSPGDYRDLTLRSQGEQLEAVLRFARSKAAYFERICVVAESLGAAALLLQRQWLDIQTAVLLWPALHPEMTSLSEHLTPEKLREAAAKGYVHDGTRLISETFLIDLIGVGDLTRHLKELIVPALVMHGEADAEVPVSQSLKAREWLPPGSRVVIVPEGEHGLLADPQFVLDQVVEWICQTL